MKHLPVKQLPFRALHYVLLPLGRGLVLCQIDPRPTFGRRFCGRFHLSPQKHECRNLAAHTEGNYPRENQRINGEFRDNGTMSKQRFFSVMEGDREVANISLLSGAAIEWNEDRTKRNVYQVAPDPNGGWIRIRQVTANELLDALRH